MKKNKPARPFMKGTLLPAATTAAGMFAGGIVGAAGARAILRSPGMRQKLSRMTPAQRRVFRDRALLVTNTAGNIAGMGSGYFASEVFREEMDKRKKNKKSKEKTASAFLHCLEYLNSHE